MLALCETVECRRAQLLAYFGQEHPGECGACDTCLTPPEAWDGTVAAQKVLSTVLRLARERGQSFGAGQVIDIRTLRRWASTSPLSSVSTRVPYSPSTVSSPWASNCRTTARHSASTGGSPMSRP